MPPLFSITTDRLLLTWSGPPPPPDASAPPGLLRVHPLRVRAAIRVEVGGETAEGAASLRLGEQTAYRVFLRSRNGDPVALRHDDPLAAKALASNENGAILSGGVNFGGQVGRSRFAASVGGADEVAFEVDVFPTKATFSEVEQIREELDEALAGLAFEYLRATTTPTSRTHGLPRRASWLTLLRHLLPEVESALLHVASHPLHDLNRALGTMRAERVRRPDAAVRRAVLQRGLGAGEEGRGARVSVLPVRRVVATMDTAEHRWLRRELESVRAALAVIREDELRLPPTARRLRVLGDLEDAERRMARLQRMEPLASVARVQGELAPTQRLASVAGYDQAYRAFQGLALSLRLADGPVLHATRELHQLYEMWCYLTVLRAVSGYLNQPVHAAPFFEVEHRGVRTVLRHGRRHAVAFDQGARRVQVTYTPRFSAGQGLLVQRPDLLLSVTDGGATTHFILDAKYRRDDSAAFRRRFGAPGPPEDALGDLHRYRDAIRDRRGVRIVEQAVALYPYRAGADFAGSRLWSAIGRVGVGAIPLVPGGTAYLRSWLERVLG